MRALTAGETMALLDRHGEGEIEHESTFTLRVAGAESNFAIALTRLGVAVTWISRLGGDRLGDVVAGTLAREGVDLRYVVRDPRAPTGLFLKWRAAGRGGVVYYRRGSAASGLSPADIPAHALEGVDLVHLTGITMALSEGARDLVVETAQRARRLAIPVLFDPNWRAPLWEGPEEAAEAQREVLPFVDWYVCGREEGLLLFEAEAAEEVAAAALDAGARNVIVRLGARGALVREGSGFVEVPPPPVDAVVDEVGAGDGFDAGFAYGLLRGRRPAECALIGNRVAAAALAGTGDWETYPRLDELTDRE
ncbi:MAG: sugar kinase [Actinomycetota bacterium]|nr:sugar kinase [Actinomycetota bacterium]